MYAKRGFLPLFITDTSYLRDERDAEVLRMKSTTECAVITAALLRAEAIDGAHDARAFTPDTTFVLRYYCRHLFYIHCNAVARIH